MTKIAKYSKTANDDDRTVNLIKSILSDHGRVMTDFIRSGDKYPNIDGFLEIVDENGAPIGKVEVQIKKLPQNHNFKFQCPVETINYAKEISFSPVLFLFGDLDERKIYWKHMSLEYIEELNEKRSGKDSKSIEIDVNCFFSLENTGYLESWINIIYMHKNTYKEYLSNKGFFDRVKSLSNPAIGRKEQHYLEIHNFLDCYNYLLDKDFKCVKDVYYPNQWKIGIALGRYEEDFISYSLYPLSYYENDVLIRQMQSDIVPDPLERYTNFCQQRPNALKNDYQAFAYSMLTEKLNNLLKHRLFSIQDCGMELYSEILFCFVDKFSRAYKYKCSMDKPALFHSNSINVNEIKYILYQLLPVIHHEVTVNGPNRELFLRNPQYAFDFDPFSGFAILPTGMTIDEIEKTIPRQMDYSFSLQSDKIPFMTLIEVIKVLESSKIETVERYGVPPDYSKLDSKKRFVWNGWSNIDMYNNIEFLISNIPRVYTNFVNRNFPELASKLTITDSDIIVSIKFCDEDSWHGPTIEYLKYTKKAYNPTIRMANEKELLYFEAIRNEWDDRFEMHGTSLLDTLIGEMPLFNSVYKILCKKFDDYFSEKTKMKKKYF